MALTCIGIVTHILPMTECEVVFTNLYFNLPNKLDCPIALSWNGFLLTNTLTYLASSKVTKKMKIL